MKATLALSVSLSLFAWLAFPAFASESDSIKLPAPQTESGRPLMQVLKDRHTSRDFGDRPLSTQTLSNLLWAANGINRPDKGKRTAPSARNRQEIDVYVVMKEGVYRYDATTHALEKVLDKDIRPLTGTQDFVAHAPVNLVYVADHSKMSGDQHAKEIYSAADTGFIAQNVYLYCASEGLAAVVRASFDGPALAKAIGLRPDQAITLAQTVGYPAK